MPEEGRDYGVTKTDSSPHCKLRSVDMSSVRWTEGFWADRFKQCREVTLPHLWNRLEKAELGHALTNLRIAAGLEQGDFAGTDWQDAWVYKWLEAASVIHLMSPDDALDRRMDQTITVIAAAQQPDGYIATQTTVRARKRFEDPSHHEMYVMGHLITAACIHRRVTGKTNFLDVACKTADYMYETLKDYPPAIAHFPINPSIIMASVELYRTTGTKKYLDLADIFINMRGSQPGGRGDQNQDRVPLRKEEHVVGHAVFFTYLYAGAADAYMETGDPSLLEALERLWHDFTEKRMYVTGGTCALHNGLSVRGDKVHEAAGDDYHLPNSTAYNETCGQVGSFMWNWRMLSISGCAAYADLMERTLYNSILSGIGLDGASWFYTNPLRWYGESHRLLSADSLQRFQPGEPPRRARICCPTNMLRTFAELHGYLYSVSPGTLWVNQYGGNVLDMQLPKGSRIRLKQETNYPWDGEIKIEIEEAPSEALSLMLRIPGWAERARISLNGRPVRNRKTPGTYSRLKRQWSPGDVILLSLPMAPRLIEANPRIEQIGNQVAVARGPIVYCLESPDLPEGVGVSEVRLPRNIKLVPQHEPGLLGGVTTLSGTARRAKEGDWSGRLYRAVKRARREKLNLTLIPYYAWANRGVSEMTVWLPPA